MNKDNETARESYLREFNRMNNQIDDIFGKGTIEVGDKIVELLKKEDLTYDGAYASLQYAYNKIKYESNFLKLG
ncbi:hypothetical protein ITR01_00220 [Pediococcus pentosaceus]|uniref:hypothetical protein n=1 Tax=Pediococcus pentosaceus TaxID=1255 RepID=UPI0018A17DB6|nr:hypothetical protein [Pediococcus pentosaceus]MBF7122862.1 hypothetical protein [Pediococcus pentosaceus]